MNMQEISSPHPSLRVKPQEPGSSEPVWLKQANTPEPEPFEPNRSGTSNDAITSKQRFCQDDGVFCCPPLKLPMRQNQPVAALSLRPTTTCSACSSADPAPPSGTNKARVRLNACIMPNTLLSQASRPSTAHHSLIEGQMVNALFGSVSDLLKGNTAVKKDQGVT